MNSENPDITRILVVDDDKDLCDLLQQYLSRESLDVSCASGGAEMDVLLQKQTFQIIILDLMMPAEDGLSILRRLRPDTDTPIIILSAKGQDTDRIIGLEVGADDYLAKPFNPRELLARIRALLRRNTASKIQNPQLVQFGKNTFDRQNSLLIRNSKEIKLTDTEANMLRLFIDHSNQTLSRDNIIDQIHGRERHPFDRSIDIHITRLRRKIEDDPTYPRHIRTVWAKGYQFKADLND